MGPRSAAGKQASRSASTREVYKVGASALLATLRGQRCRVGGGGDRRLLTSLSPRCILVVRMKQKPLSIVLALVAAVIACKGPERPRNAQPAAAPTPAHAGAGSAALELAHPLLAAAMAGDLAGVRAELGKGVDPGLEEDGRSAIVLAAGQGHLDIVVLLLDKPQVTASQREGALVIAAAAGQRPVVERLLRAKVSINGTAPHGLTPLILAAYAGQVEMVTFLLAHGADPDRVNEDHETALHAAAAHPRSETIVPLLIKSHARVDIADKYGRIPLNVHADTGHLLAVQALLEAGSELDHVDNDGQTPLTSAAFNGHAAVVAELLKRGADRDHVNTFGATPAMVAAQAGHVDVLARLADAGANMRYANKEGRDALSYAVEANKPAAVELLLDRKVPLRAPAGAEYSALMTAAIAGSDGVIPILVHRGADINELHDIGDAEISPLMMAAAKQHESTVRALIQAGANVNLSGKGGATALHIAAIAGCRGCVDALLAAKARVDAKNSTGGTPLRSAADGGHADIVKVLLAHGANRDNVDAFGKRAIDYARDNHHADVVDLLR
ncbi:MAG TPA: ankyrin repeat domain-containing protein [Kofleriaceae bacterium]|nr:ankyrin repeat domain-containing protein [Kofleriaceae bacterium]